MDDRKVRLRIVSVMTDPQGERHETKHARLGALREEHGSVVLTYEDEQDGERAHVVLTASADSAQMRRMGAMSGMLRFEPGVRTSSAYVTVYGEIPLDYLFSRMQYHWKHGQTGAISILTMMYMSAERRLPLPRW